MKNTNELSDASEYFREGLGVFATNQDLENAAMTSPLHALGRCLGIRIAAPPQLRAYDQQVLENRRYAYGIGTVK